jgi:hypothetical protein
MMTGPRSLHPLHHYDGVRHLPALTGGVRCSAFAPRLACVRWSRAAAAPCAPALDVGACASPAGALPHGEVDRSEPAPRIGKDGRLRSPVARARSTGWRPAVGDRTSAHCRESRRHHFGWSPVAAAHARRRDSVAPFPAADARHRSACRRPRELASPAWAAVRFRRCAPCPPRAPRDRASAPGPASGLRMTDRLQSLPAQQPARPPSGEGR